MRGAVVVFIMSRKENSISSPFSGRAISAWPQCPPAVVCRFLENCYRPFFLIICSALLFFYWLECQLLFLCYWWCCRPICPLKAAAGYFINPISAFNSPTSRRAFQSLLRFYRFSSCVWRSPIERSRPATLWTSIPPENGGRSIWCPLTRSGCGRLKSKNPETREWEKSKSVGGGGGGCDTGFGIWWMSDRSGGLLAHPIFPKPVCC